MQEELRALIARHCRTLEQEMKDVRACLAPMDDPKAPLEPILREGIELTHKIKGSSGSIGFAEISAAAERLEHYLRELGPALKEVECEQAKQHLGELERLVATARPEASTLYNAAGEMA